MPPFTPGFELVSAPPEVASGAPILHTTSTWTVDARGHHTCYYSAAFAPHQPRPDELKEELNQVYKARELLWYQATMLERELERHLSFLFDLMVLDMENLYTPPTLCLSRSASPTSPSLLMLQVTFQMGTQRHHYQAFLHHLVAGYCPLRSAPLGAGGRHKGCHSV